MTDDKQIIGFKGDEQHTPTEAPNTLRSKAIARLVDLVSEGEIVGLVDGMKSVYLDETPIQNANDSYNFENVQIAWRVGTQTQDFIPGFAATENELSINVKVDAGTPLVRSFNNLDVTALRVRMSVPALSETNQENGDITGSKVNYVVEIATDGGPFVQKLSDWFNGKTMSPYERSFRIDLPPATSGWDLRIRRITPDATSSAIQNDTFCESITEIVDAKMRYPNSAIIATTFAAEQFRAIPSRAFDLKGRIIRVPANYNPATRVYATTGTGTTGGVWDGTFKLAWTDNPAWCFYDLVTHTRYGLGKLVGDGRVNKWMLYKIGQYCDGLVPDGFGGMEPRFTCNMYLQTQSDAYRVIQDMASVFRGMMYWANGEVIPGCDMPEDPAYVYTRANVIDGAFTYEGTARKVRHTVALITWNDMDNFARAKVEYVADTAAIAKFGIQQTEIVAIGCTSRGQAHRLGKYLLTTAQYETQSLSFKVGLDGQIAVPGMIIRVQDPLRAGKRLGGRVRSATTTTVTLDSIPEATVGDTITVIMSDGVSQTRTISSVTSGNIVHVSTAFSAAPAAESVWAIDRSDLETQRYRVIGVVDNEDGTYTINAVEHNASKFDVVDLGTKIDIPPTSQFPTSPAGDPTDVKITSHDTHFQVNTGQVLHISWKPARNAVKHYVAYQRNGGRWIGHPATTASSIDVASALPGTYRARVVSASATGFLSQTIYSSEFVLADQTDTPGFVETLQTDITGALDTALEARDIADSKIESFYQPTAPAVAGEGDIWFDTDAGNKIYTRRSGVWVATPDSDIALAIAAASTAQATADGKVKTFFQDAQPTASGVGDLWIDTNDGNKLYRWSGSAWQVAKDTGIAQALLEAQNAQSTADGKITSWYQTTPPVIGLSTGQARVGDIWFDTNDGNKLYRVVGSAWVVSTDDDLAQALNNAAGAQATADGKVQTFFQGTPPTATAVGDLWFDTITKKLYRWSGTDWSQSVGDNTEDQIAGSGVNILWDEYARLNTGTPPAVTRSNTTLTLTYDPAQSVVNNDGSLKVAVNDPAGNPGSNFVSFGNSTTDYNLPLQPGKKYLVSAYLRSSNASAAFRAGLRTAVSGTIYNSQDVQIDVANTFVRMAFVVDASANLYDAAELMIYFNRNAFTTPFNVWIDRIMVEELKGNLTTPSTWQPGPAGRQALIAISNAAVAQSTADGKITSFYQTTAPVIGSGSTQAKLGDIWFDTDDGNKIYTVVGAAWVATPDSRIAQAITDAAGAQATADGKVQTFYQDTTPTATAVGDLWYNESTSELKRWSGSKWEGADGVAGNGVNLLPNSTFTSNSLGVGSSVVNPVGSPLIDGWKVTSQPAATSCDIAWIGSAQWIRMREYGADALASGAQRFTQAVTMKPVPIKANKQYRVYVNTSHSFNGSLPGGLTLIFRVWVNWYDATNTVITTSTPLDLTRGMSGDQISATMTAPADAKYAHVFFGIYCRNQTGASWTHNSSVAFACNLISIGMSQVNDLEVAGSGVTVGDQRNLPNTLTTNYGSVRTTTALSATSAGAISVLAHTVRYGSISVPYSAVSNAVTGKAVGTSWVIYCRDPANTGGVKTWFAGTTPEAVMNIADDVVVAGVITIPSSGSSSGGGGGGGGPIGYCVDADMVLPDGRRAGDLQVGDLIPCWNEDAANPLIEYRDVQAIIIMANQPSTTLITANGAMVTASDTTPMTLRDGSTTYIPDMLGREVLVRDANGVVSWHTVVELLDAGLRTVAKISVHQSCYFTGYDASMTIATHNPLKP